MALSRRETLGNVSLTTRTFCQISGMARKEFCDRCSAHHGTMPRSCRKPVNLVIITMLAAMAAARDCAAAIWAHYEVTAYNARKLCWPRHARLNAWARASSQRRTRRVSLQPAAASTSGIDGFFVGRAMHTLIVNLTVPLVEAGNNRASRKEAPAVPRIPGRTSLGDRGNTRPHEDAPAGI